MIGGQKSWNPSVQVQQCVGHKWTCLYLEQLILENTVHVGCLSIETFRDGVFVYLPDKDKMARFMSFLEDVVLQKLNVHILI